MSVTGDRAGRPHLSLSTQRQHPTVDETGGGVTLHDIAHTVVVEVAQSCCSRTGRMVADIHARQPLAVLDR